MTSTSVGGTVCRRIDSRVSPSVAAPLCTGTTAEMWNRLAFNPVLPIAGRQAPSLPVPSPLRVLGTILVVRELQDTSLGSSQARRCQIAEEPPAGHGIGRTSAPPRQG